MIRPSEFQPLWKTLIISVVIFCVHAGILYSFNVAWDVPGLEIVRCYVFFTLFASVITLAMIFFRKSHADKLGFIFLLLTGIQMGLAFWLVNKATGGQSLETSAKLNVIFVFLSFLALETSVSFKLINSAK